MAGVDYRQLQSPEQVRTDLPDSGAAARAQALGSLFKEFEGVAGEQYTKAQTTAGSLAGAAAGATGHPAYREGLARFTAYSQAFNNAATGAYAIQAQTQADEAATRLRVQANNNPDTFRTTYSAVRDSVLKSAPAEAVPMLTELYNKHLAAGLAAVSGDQATEQLAVARQEYDWGIDKQVSRVATLMGSADPHDHMLAMDEQTKLSIMIDGSKNAGLHSEAEAAAMHVNAMRAITGQVFSTQVDRELADPKGDVVTLMDNFRAAHVANLADKNQPPILAEAEFQKLMADANQKIREWHLTYDLAKGNAKSAEQVRFEAGDVKYTGMLLDGSLTPRMLAAAEKSGDLKPETARSLSDRLSLGTVTHSNPLTLMRALQDPNLPGKTPEEIASTPGLSNADMVKVGQEAQRQRNNWEGTQQAKDAISSISVALKVPPGTPQGALSDLEKTAVANATLDFKTRINALPPEQRAGAYQSVAQEVVKGIKRQEVQDNIVGIHTAVERTLKAHGPGAVDAWPPDKLKAYQDQRNAQIKTLQQQLKGP